MSEMESEKSGYTWIRTPLLLPTVGSKPNPLTTWLPSLRLEIILTFYACNEKKAPSCHLTQCDAMCISTDI